MQLFGNSEQLILIEKAAIIGVYGDKRMDYVMLKDVCAINMGQSPDSNSYNDEGQGVPFFQGNADFGERYPVTRKWCSAPTKMAMPDDILISVRAPIGAMNYAKEECCIGRGLAALTPDKSKVSPQFIFWLLKGKNQELNSKGTGSTFKAIGRKVLEETLVPNVPLEKQVKYSAILEKVYAIIQSRNAQLQKLDELVKAQFIEMFGDPRYNSKGWKTEHLEKICKVSSSKRIYQNEQRTEGVPFLRISDLNERIDNVKNAPELFIPINKYNELKENGLVPTEGDILVTSRGTLGRCYIVRPEDEFYFQDGMISWLSDLNSQITSVYLSQLFAMSGIQKQIASLQAGSTVAYLSITMLKKLNIMLPPLDRQEQFAAFVEQADKSKAAVQKALDEAQLLFDSLMQKYFG